MQNQYYPSSNLSIQFPSGSNLSPRSGQALVEVCIGITLLILVWMLVTFIGTMSNNYLRTAMAVRHAAWIRGNGGTPSAEKIYKNFFFETDPPLMELKSIPSINDHLDVPHEFDSIDSELLANSQGGGPYRYQVSYGINSNQVDQTTYFPFTLLKIAPPFMPTARFESLLKVESSCQWDQVSNSWEKTSSAWSWIKELIIEETLQQINGFIDWIFSTWNAILSLIKNIL